jgi:hypothetical protein
MRLVVTSLLLTAACQAQLGRMPNGDKPDAAKAADAAVDAEPIDAAPDANPCGNNRVVYLNFTGATIAKANTADATQNDAAWVGLDGGGATTATMPAWTGNAASIDAIVNQLTTTFTAIDPNIKFVTTAPTNGPYIMIGFGGGMGNAHVPYTGAVNTLDCGDTNKSDLGWVFQTGNNTTAANYAAGAIGYGMGMGGTGNSGDCMCSWNSNCAPNGNACTFSSNINTQNGCANAANPQNDVAVLQTFCD